MEEVYKEEDFYREEGWPSESLKYFSYRFLSDKETESSGDYDQFALVYNALYPYVRLTKKRGAFQSPCGLGKMVPTSSSFARKSDEEREIECPKIIWGFAAIYLSELRYDNNQKDYVEKINRDQLIKDFYNKYLHLYLQSHNGIRYSKISNEQKELDFIAGHEIIIRDLWEKSYPLKKYTTLYEYASDAETDYENYLQKRKAELNKQIEERLKPNRDAKSAQFETVTQTGDKSVFINENYGNITIK